MANFKNHNENYDKIVDKLDAKEDQIYIILNNLAKTNQKMKNRILAMKYVERQKLIKEIRDSWEEINEKTVEKAIEKHTKLETLNKINIPSKKEIVIKAREEIDKQIKSKVKLPGMLWGLWDWIANWLTSSIWYSLDKKMLESNNMTQELFEEKHWKPSWFNIWGWFKNMISSLALSAFWWDKIDELIGKITSSAWSFPTTVAAAWAWMVAAWSTFKESVGANGGKVLEAKEKVKNKVDEVKEWVKSKKEKANNKPTVVEKLMQDKKKTIPFSTWNSMLRWLSWITFENSNLKLNKINNILSLKSISKIKNIYSYDREKIDFLNSLKGENKLDDNEKKPFDKILKIFSDRNDSDTPRYLDITMKSKYLESIIKPNDKLNESLVKNIEWGKTRLDEILKLSENNKDNNDWWEELTYQEISILHFYSLPALWLISTWALSSVFLEMSKNIWGFLTNWINLDKIKESWNDIMSGKIITVIFSEDDTWWINLTKWNRVEKLFKNIKLNDKEKIQLEELIEFKDYILWKFLNEDKLCLKWHKETFKKNIDYKWILSLYWIMWGVKDFSSLSPTNKMTTVLWVFEVLGSGSMLTMHWVWNKTEAHSYLWNYYSEITNEDSKTFNEDDREIFEVYKDRFFDILAPYYLAQNSAALWFIDEHLVETMLVWWIWWTWSLLLSNHLSKKWWKVLKWWLVKTSTLNIKWGWALKILWWTGIIFWLGAATREYYKSQKIDFSEQQKELEKALESRDFKELEKYFEKVKANTKVINVDWSNEKIYYFNWPNKDWENENGVFFYKGEAYTTWWISSKKDIIDIYEEKMEFSEKVLKIWKSLWSSISSSWEWTSTWKVNIDWKSIPYSISKVDWEYLIIWEWKDTIKIKFSEIAKHIWDKTKENKSKAQKLDETISDGEHNNLILELLYDKETNQEYIPIKEYPNDWKTLVLFKEKIEEAN